MGLQNNTGRILFSKLAATFLCLIILLSGVACQKACKKTPPPASYNPAIPLTQKVQGVLPWVPSDADLMAVIDTHKLLTSLFYSALPSNVRQAFPWEYMHSGGEALSSRLGLVASFIKFGAKNDPFHNRALLLQGDLKKDDILKWIEESSKKDGKQIETTTEAGVTIYQYTNDDDDLNSIAFLETNLIAIGTKEGIGWIAAEHKKNMAAAALASPLNGLDLNQTAAARISMTENLKEFFPPLFHPIQNINVNAGIADGLDLKVVFTFAAPKTAVEFAKNLEGLKAIEEITSLDNKWLRNLIGAIKIGTEGERVTCELSASAKLLLKLLGDEDK